MPIKTFLTLFLLMACTLSGFAQGQIVFNNRVVGEIIAPVYGYFPGSSFRQVGQAPEGYPAGTTIYNGPRVEGTGYTVELWGGPFGTSERNLAPAVNGKTTFRTGPAACFWVETTAIIPGVPENAQATLQVRVWDNGGGTITTWQQALTDLTKGTGVSQLFTSMPLGGLFTTPPNLIGLTSFSVPLTVPEPGSIMLGLLGSGALLLLGRFRR